MDYKVTITSIIDQCPFDARKRSKAYCNICKSYKDPCKGIGTESVLTRGKVSKKEMQQIINIIRNSND